MPSSRKNSSTWQTSAKRSPTTSRIVLQAGKWHEPISHSARRARLQPASEEADGVLLDGNGNKGPGRSLRDTLTARQASRTGCAIPWHGTHEAARIDQASRRRGRSRRARGARATTGPRAADWYTYAPGLGRRGCAEP